MLLMDKSLVLMGMGAMIIGVCFVFSAFYEPESSRFYMGSGVWVIGGISLILGLTVFSKEKWFYSLR